jgi:hypothetical protein
MKKTIEIKISAQKARTKQQEVTLCDICGKPDPKTSGYSQMTKCCLCGRDVHFRYNNPCSKSEPDEWGGYPAYYCVYCYELRYETHRKEIEDIEEYAFNAKEGILLKVKQQSLEKGSPKPTEI